MAMVRASGTWLIVAGTLRVPMAGCSWNRPAAISRGRFRHAERAGYIHDPRPRIVFPRPWRTILARDRLSPTSPEPVHAPPRRDRSSDGRRRRPGRPVRLLHAAGPVEGRLRRL